MLRSIKCQSSAFSISTSNWDPPVASNYLTLTWNQGGQKIVADTTIPVTITLTVSGDITGINTINFDITAVGKYDA